MEFIFLGFSVFTYLLNEIYNGQEVFNLKISITETIGSVTK
jgi:hypothetical protein